MGVCHLRVVFGHVVLSQLLSLRTQSDRKHNVKESLKNKLHIQIIKNTLERIQGLER